MAVPVQGIRRWSVIQFLPKQWLSQGRCADRGPAPAGYLLRSLASERVAFQHSPTGWLVSQELLNLACAWGGSSEPHFLFREYNETAGDAIAVALQ